MVAWRAQLRLCARYRKFTARGMNSNKVCVAIARELTGRRRNRVFAYDAYLKLLNEGGQPL